MTRFCWTLTWIIAGMLAAQNADAQSLGSHTKNNHAAQSAFDDFEFGGPADHTWQPPRIHTIIDDRGRVLYRYLRIEGTQSGDDIRITAAAGISSVVFEGLNTYSFDMSDYDFIIMYGLAGDDYLSNRAPVPDIIFGGLGDDTIGGGPQSSWIFGQDGNDSINAKEGSDLVFGQEGNDLIAGGTGYDEVFGGPGADELSGGNAPENKTGVQDSWPDLLIGGSGPDIFWIGDPKQDEIEDLMDEDMIEN